MNKQVCKRCRMADEDSGWDKFNDELWIYGQLSCPILGNRVMIIQRNPPKDCPFVFEHEMLSRWNRPENRKNHVEEIHM